MIVFLPLTKQVMSGVVYVEAMSGVRASVADLTCGGPAAADLGGIGSAMVVSLESQQMQQQGEVYTTPYSYYVRQQA